jgi:outer membrane lipoprotein-sorting protein
MKATLLFGLLTCLSASAMSAADAQAILKSSDVARGGGLPGISWKISVSTMQDGKQQDNDLTVKAVSQSSLVEFLAPARVRGQKLLMTGNTMWFSQPGVQRPVPISARQKLSGQAANGDIAATNYAADYSATIEREEACGAEQCAVLRLKAANKGVTYDQILYWISLKRNLGVKAEFYSVSGKLFKSATFVYQNHISYKGAQIPFISRMVISDALNAGNVTTLEYSDVRAANIPPSEFNVDLLVR